MRRIINTTLHDQNSDPSVSAERLKSPVAMKVRGLHKAFDGQVVLSGVDFDLHAGEVVLLRGPNGSGKTTLLNILSGNMSPDAGSISLTANGNEKKETFDFPRSWWQNLNPFDHFLPERVAREGIGRSWQETRLFPSLHLIDNISAASPEHPGENPLNVLFHPNKVRSAEKKVLNDARLALQELGLSGREASSGDMISLGQSKRIAIARAVQAGAKILFLDEPLSGLDAAGIESVMKLLKSLVKVHRITLVIVEHVWNVVHVASMADTIWDLDQGRLSTSTNHTIKPADAQTTEPTNFISDLFSDFDLSHTLDLPRGAKLDIYRRPGSHAATNVLQIRDLMVRRGSRLIVGDNSGKNVSGLDFSLQTGDLAILQAPNGWGKTTLLDALAGLLPLQKGHIHFAGKDLTFSPPWERYSSGLRYLRADSKGFASLNLKETLKLSGHSKSGNPVQNPRRRYGQLSGGEKKQMQFKTLQSKQAKFIMLDEPFSALDNVSIANIANVINGLFSGSVASIIIAFPTI